MARKRILQLTALVIILAIIAVITFKTASYKKEITSDSGSTSYEVYSTEEEKLLFGAIKRGDLEEIKKILVVTRGADINATFESRSCFGGNSGETVLHTAIKQPKVIELLLNEGANIESSDRNGVTPLMLAASKGEIETIKVLLKRGANVEARNPERRNSLTPLETAVEMGNTKIVRFLLSKGANYSEYKEKDKAIEASLVNELYTAISRGKPDNIKRIVGKEGINVNSDYQGDYKYKSYGRPIIHAVAYGDTRIEILKYLLDKGADVTFKDSKGMTALDKAKKFGMIESVKILSPYYDNEDSTKILAHLELQKRFFELLKKNDVNGVKESIKGGAKVHVNCNELIAIQRPCPALKQAISQENIELMDVLVKAGADINLYNNDKGKLSALEDAAWMGKTKAALWLIEKGAIVDRHEEYGRTALHNAAYSNDVKVINALLDKGANIEAYNLDGTPLIWAANRGSLDAVKTLIDRGANANATTSVGQTALFKAKHNAKRRGQTFKDAKYQEVADYLDPLEDKNKVKESYQKAKELHRKLAKQRKKRVNN